MGKKHLKRLSAPKAWHIKRKSHKFITSSASGPHSPEAGLSLGTLVREVLNHTQSNRESKKIMNAGEIKIDGKIRKNSRFPVGIFDTIEFAGINENFRVIITKKGKLDLIRIKKEECLVKPCKIIGKSMINGKLQLNLYDGNNILVDKGSYKVGDTLILSLPGKKIAKHLKLDKTAAIFLTGGKHIGEIGNVEDIAANKIVYKNSGGELVETSKKYAFVVGDNKPSITLSET